MFVCRAAMATLRTLDVKQGDAVRPAEQLTERSGQLTANKARGRMDGSPIR